MNIAQALAEAKSVLVASLGEDQASLESQVLLASLLGKPRSWLFAHPEHDIGAAEAQFRVMVGRRFTGEPLEYITGRVEFYGLALAVSPAVLVPRPETEILVEASLEALASHVSPLVADVGTGSGAIALAIAAQRPDARIVATDLSLPALAVAAHNMQQLSLQEHVDLVCCDLLSAVAARFQLIAANLPYVASGEMDSDSQTVARFEPHLALDGGPDGLAQVRRLLPVARDHLLPGGMLLAEIGARQGKAAVTLALSFYRDADVSVLRDLAGLDRVLRVRFSS